MSFKIIPTILLFTNHILVVEVGSIDSMITCGMMDNKNSSNGKLIQRVISRMLLPGDDFLYYYL